MYPQLKSILQQSLQHAQHLSLIWTVSRLGVYVVLLRPDPLRAANNLEGLHLIGTLYQNPERRIRSEPSGKRTHKGDSGALRHSYGGDFELRPRGLPKHHHRGDHNKCRCGHSHRRIRAVSYTHLTLPTSDLV